MEAPQNVQDEMVVESMQEEEEATPEPSCDEPWEVLMVDGVEHDRWLLHDFTRSIDVDWESLRPEEAPQETATEEVQTPHGEDNLALIILCVWMVITIMFVTVVTSVKRRD